MIREFFLQQNGFDPVDAYCDIKLHTRWPRPSCPSKKPPRPPWLTVLNDVVNVPACSNLMRGRFEEGYIDRIETMVKEMNEQIANAVEAK